MSHPEIGSLVRAKDQMIDNLKKKNYIGALSDMRGLLIEIKESDVEDKKLFDNVGKEENQARGTESNRQYNRHLETSAHTYWKWAHQIIQILWDKGYLSDKKYGVEPRRDTTFKDTKPWTEE